MLKQPPAGGRPKTTKPPLSPWVAPTSSYTPVIPYKSPYSVDTDPGYRLSLANQQEGLSGLDALLRQQRSQAAVGFGDEALAKTLGLDSAAQAAAKANYASGNSTLARLDFGNTLSKRGIVNTLAARGLINSGDLGYREGLQNRYYGNQVADARTALMDALNGYQSNYLNQKSSLQQAVTQALMQAYQNQLSYAQQYGTGYQQPTAPGYTGDGSTQSARDYLGSLPKASSWW